MSCAFIGAPPRVAGTPPPVVYPTRTTGITGRVRPAGPAAADRHGPAGGHPGRPGPGAARPLQRVHADPAHEVVSAGDPGRPAGRDEDPGRPAGRGGPGGEAGRVPGLRLRT